MQYMYGAECKSWEVKDKIMMKKSILKGPAISIDHDRTWIDDREKKQAEGCTKSKRGKAGL